MMNMKEIKYNQLLDLEWALRRQEIHAKSHWDRMYQEYGKKDKNDLLTELAYETVKELREAQKTVKQVVEVLRANDLYTNEA
jgi:hypothetical protein